jgi:phosphoadenosine phosphosulfate reductase
MKQTEPLGSLRARFGSLDGVALLTAINEQYAGRVAVISSFGAESAVLLDLVAQVDKAMPVIFVDTGELFDETVAYQAALTQSLGLSDMRVVRPTAADKVQAADLWRSDPDRCCHLRKVLPLEAAVRDFEVLVDGRKRYHGGDRGDIETIDIATNGTIKVSPLARWGQQAIEAAFVERNLPTHPLVAQGYRSIGCWPCSRAAQPGESVRAGRWAGLAKTECGIHRKDEQLIAAG